MKSADGTGETFYDIVERARLHRNRAAGKNILASAQSGFSCVVAGSTTGSKWLLEKATQPMRQLNYRTGGAPSLNLGLLAASRNRENC